MSNNYVSPKGLRRRGKTWHLSFTPSKGEKQRHVSLHTDDYQTALQKAQAIRERPQLAGIGIWEEDMGNYCKFRIERRSMSETTITSTMEACLRFFEFTGKKTAREITEEDVGKFITHLESLKRTQSTINTYHARLSAFFNFLVQFHKVEENPFDEWGVHKIIPSQIAREKWLGKDEIKKLISKCKDRNLKFVLYCGFHAGLRKQEIIMSKPSYFDIQQRKLNIPFTDETPVEEKTHRFRTKNLRSRTIPLSDEFHRFLTTFPMGKTFCLEKKGKGFGQRYRYDFRRPLDEFFKEQHVNLTTHGMRHSFASNCIMAGVSTFKVAAWMGNRERTVETHYAHLATGRGDLDGVF